jgi:GT2 family glycosyltransferase
MSDSVDLTVIVTSFETRALTLACLEAVERARLAAPGLGVETWVIDNGSRDGSAAAIARAHPDVRLVALVRNRGFAAAVNIGMCQARGRHLLLLNSDVVIEPDLLSAGVALLDEQPGIGVLGVSLRHPDGRPQRSVHALPDWISELLPGSLLRLIRPGSSLPSELRPDRVGRRRGRRRVVEAEAVRGAVFFVRGAMLERVGLLDESYFFFLEETDYCRRVREAGARVGHALEIFATHQLGASSKRRAPLVTRIEYHRSLYRYLGEHQGPGVLLLARILRALRTSLALIGLTVLAPFSVRVRARWVERAGLLVWHLRGCPSEPRFVDAIAERTPADGELELGSVRGRRRGEEAA